MEASPVNNFDAAGRMYARNYGFYSEAEQEALANSTVSIAGAGGDGFQLGMKIAMAGVGNLRVADPEVFERENANRVIAAGERNCGLNKAEVFKQWAENLPSHPNVTIFTEGVNEDNLEDFMQGADLVLDESELTYPHIGTMIARQAVKQSIPNLFVMNIAHAGVATSFHPGGRFTFEKMMGIPEGAPLDEVAEMKVDFTRALPYIPKYGDLRTLQAVQEGAPLPSVGTGVDMAAGIGSSEAILHLTSGVKNNRLSPTWAKTFRYMDAYTGKSGKIRHPRASYYIGATTMAARSYLGINPQASYTQEDRDRRANSR